MTNLGFISLPKELRDLIYGFVLTHRGPLHYRSKRTFEGRLEHRFYTSNDDHNEFNQLKYVCLQLWKETRGLEVELNDLAFRSQPEDMHTDIDDQSQVSSEVCGARLLCNFAPFMPSSFTSRNIYIQDLPQEWEIRPNGISVPVEINIEDEDILPLFGLCQSNPNIVIYMDISNCDASRMELVSFLQTASYAIEVRRKGIPKELVPFIADLIRLNLHLDENRDVLDIGKVVEKEWPGNFRLKPQGNFDEGSFRKKLEEGEHQYLDVDKLCVIAAQWHVNGFLGEQER